MENHKHVVPPSNGCRVRHQRRQESHQFDVDCTRACCGRFASFGSISTGDGLAALEYYLVIPYTRLSLHFMKLLKIIGLFAAGFPLLVASRSDVGGILARD